MPRLFSGLTALDDLFLNGNELSSLDPEELFSGLTALDNRLELNDNALESLLSMPSCSPA